MKKTSFFLIFLILSLTFLSLLSTAKADGAFGYTSIGASTQTEANYIRGTVFTCPEAGTAQSITVYLSDYSLNGGNAKCALYLDSDESFVVGTEERAIGAGDFAGWYTFTLTTPTAVTNQAYWIVVFTDFLVYRHYDTDAGVVGTSYPYTYGDWPSTLPVGANTRKFSIYCNYTTAGGPSHTDAELSETIAVTSIFDSQKSLNRYSSETTATTASLTTTKTLYRSSGSSFTVETTTETQKDLNAMFIEHLETVTVTASLYTTKHIAATLIELTETLTVIAGLYTDLLVELTTSDLLGLIIVFSVIALAIAVCALALHFKKQ